MNHSVAAGLMSIQSSNSIGRKVSTSVIGAKHNVKSGKFMGCVEDGISNGCDLVIWCSIYFLVLVRINY